MKNIKLITTSLMVTTLSATTVFGADLTLKIAPPCNDEGKVFLSLFDDKDAFENQHDIKAVANFELRASTVESKITIHDLKKGRYAVSVLHDQNENELLDMKGIMPQEGYAFSNGVGKNTLPDFKEAAIDLRHDDLTIPLRFTYHSSKNCSGG